MDAIFLGEFNRERSLEGVEVGEGQLDDLAALFAAEYESRLWIFNEMRCLLLYGTLGAGGLGRSGVVSSRPSDNGIYIRCFQHGCDLGWGIDSLLGANFCCNFSQTFSTWI
jgi:hypothetical protein